jgi:L-alanine-DL-glutamate epimerase-like enolase superfamily enzyme
MPQTSFTIGIDKPETMLAKVDEASDFPVLKIKMGTEDDVDVLGKIVERFRGRIRVDANGGWGVAEAVRKMRILSELGVEFVEQPLPPEMNHELCRLRDAVDIPIFVDESVEYPHDLAVLVGKADGINIKLMKCGGITTALDMIATARALSFDVMIGCMVETSLAISAAAQLCPLVDYADLDGHLLLAKDPFEGVSVHNGLLELSDAPGLGVRARK